MTSRGTRDPEATKARIFGAATEEFAAYGIAGARIDRIAREAKANKQLIYAYFGNKTELFAKVLERNLVDLIAEIPIDAENPEAWADRLLDYHGTRPQLARLMLWESLEYGSDVAASSLTTRSEHYAHKVEVFAQAQRDGLISRDIPPGDLVFLLVTLLTARTTLPQVRRLLAGDGAEDDARLRTSIRTAVHRITAT
ncbi:TetR/AcrR family transcriptional regulator [Streptomyces boncukensis]|uniref:TetR/AcrR family transcriptional regulator n=1 Tax=Streptomyces boncukensis TaxID=2711219 RepID=A0A6G4WX16_9ACTN|nr:TetR family transcriptional regulator [Streptomyces boncukensis]NGO69064.1 TetR/AcrR family transcriptional regulator [Streptomyces boncukensis]